MTARTDAEQDMDKKVRVICKHTIRSKIEILLKINIICSRPRFKHHLSDLCFLILVDEHTQTRLVFIHEKLVCFENHQSVVVAGEDLRFTLLGNLGFKVMYTILVLL